MFFKKKSFKMKIIVAPCLLILLVSCNRVSSHTEVTSENLENIDVFKNKEIVLKNLIPDLTLLTNLSEKKFESLYRMLNAWDSLHDQHLKPSKDVPFTIIVPKIDIKTIEKPKLKEFFLEHVIPGEAFNTFNEEDVYGNCNQHKIIFKHVKKGNESIWTLNEFKILRTAVLNEKSSVIYIDGVLGDRKAVFSKRNIQETNRYNEPQRLEWKNATKDEQTLSKREPKQNDLMSFLSHVKTGTRIFQHFLSKSNLSQAFDEGQYAVLVPSDSAFQRWHPIDWGFYPFSVTEFTEGIMRNHFVPAKSPLRIDDRTQRFKTLGGDMVVFRGTPSPSVNNVTIVADYTLPNGNQLFLISEVLFMSESVVTRLHQMHKDKETPPLLAFPWFGAQFLSHSFLALEKDDRFTHITRFLNNAEIAHFISGSNYTFFVPMDGAFEKLGLHKLTDDEMASESSVKLLLNHFVKGRLYDRDLINDEVLEAVGGKPIKIQRLFSGNITVNHANIVETEIFVYNLGTMFYIDEVLYADAFKDFMKKSTNPTVESKTGSGNSFNFTAKPDVEAIPSEFITEANGKDRNKDVLIDSDTIESLVATAKYDSDSDLDDDNEEVVTPLVLPVKYAMEPPKK